MHLILCCMMWYSISVYYKRHVGTLTFSWMCPQRTCFFFFFLNTTFEKIGPVKRRVTAATRTTTENIYQGQAWYVLGLGKVGSLVWFDLHFQRIPLDSMELCWNIKCFSGSVFEEWIFMYNVFSCIKHVIWLIHLSHEGICFFVCILCGFFPQKSHGEFVIRPPAFAGPTQFNTDGGLPNRKKGRMMGRYYHGDLRGPPY